MFKGSETECQMALQKSRMADAPRAGLRGTGPRLQDAHFSLALQSEYQGPFLCGVGVGGRQSGWCCLSHPHRCQLLSNSPITPPSHGDPCGLSPCLPGP